MPGVLADFSNALAETVAALDKSTVRVEGRDRLPATGIVWSADGTILTAHHVVEQDENIGVGLPDGQTMSAKLVGRDPTTDLAVLKIEGAPASGLAAPRWADPGAMRVGNV